MKTNANYSNDDSDNTIACTKADVAEHARFDEEEVCYEVEE